MLTYATVACHPAPTAIPATSIGSLGFSLREIYSDPVQESYLSSIGSSSYGGQKRITTGEDRLNVVDDDADGEQWREHLNGSLDGGVAREQGRVAVPRGYQDGRDGNSDHERVHHGHGQCELGRPRVAGP